MCVLLAIAAGLIAQVLMHLIWFITDLAFYGRLGFGPSAPPTDHLGGWVILVPVVGGVIVGFMARYGSKAIRGHGIPEAMEQVLLNQSRIPARMTFLKPLQRRRSRSGPAGRSAPRGRSSPPAGRWAR